MLGFDHGNGIIDLRFPLANVSSAVKLSWEGVRWGEGPLGDVAVAQVSRAQRASARPHHQQGHCVLQLP